MAQQYTIELIEGVRPWNGRYGAMVSYDTKLVGGERVEIVQKPQTTPPESGEVIFGDIESQTVHPKDGSEPFTKLKFKKAQPEEGQQPPAAQPVDTPQGVVPTPTPAPPVQAPQKPSQATQTASQQGRPPSITSSITEKDRLIVAQVALKGAIELHAAELGAGEMAMPERVKALAAEIEDGFWKDWEIPF